MCLVLVLMGFVIVVLLVLTARLTHFVGDLRDSVSYLTSRNEYLRSDVDGLSSKYYETYARANNNKDHLTALVSALKYEKIETPARIMYVKKGKKSV